MLAFLVKTLTIQINTSSSLNMLAFLRRRQHLWVRFIGLIDDLPFSFSFPIVKEKATLESLFLMKSLKTQKPKWMLVHLCNEQIRTKAFLLIKLASYCKLFTFSASLLFKTWRFVSHWRLCVFSTLRLKWTNPQKQQVTLGVTVSWDSKAKVKVEAFWKTPFLLSVLRKMQFLLTLLRKTLFERSYFKRAAPEQQPFKVNFLGSRCRIMIIFEMGGL